MGSGIGRSRAVLWIALALLWGLPSPVMAQEEEDGFIPWDAVPTEEKVAPTPPPTPAPVEPSTPPLPAPEVPSRPSQTVPQPRVETPSNRVSLYGAQPLGAGKGAVGVYLGFPLVGARAAYGVVEGVDVGLGLDSFYGVMNEVRATMRLRLLGDDRRGLAFGVEGGHAWFLQGPDVEQRGARWLTGRRNWNLEPGLVASWRGDTVQSARLFVDVRWHLAFDTQPFSEQPLGGVPPRVLLGHNVPVRFGAELPFSQRTSFLFMAGFDIHGREIDSAFMPVISVGLVSGL